MSTDTDQAPPRPKLPLRKFDPSTMPDNSTCVIVAESEGGKTTLAIDLMKHKRHLPAWYLFSESEGCSGRLSHTIPPTYTFSEFQKKKLEEIYVHQESKMIRYARPRSEADRRLIPDDELSIEERFIRNPCVGGFFEDCFGDKKIFSVKEVQNLFKNGRHRMLFSIIPCQYVIDLPIACRKQVKYWFILREDSKEVRQKLFKHIGGACRTFEVFEEIMQLTNSDFRCIVIDNISKSKELTDRVFWYKADLHPAFKVGCKRYWDFHKANFKPHEVVDDAEREAKAKLDFAREQQQQRKRKRDGGGSLTMHQKVQPAVRNGYGDQQYNNNNNESDYLHTESMMDAFESGKRHMDELLNGGKKHTPKFDVVMMPNQF